MLQFLLCSIGTIPTQNEVDWLKSQFVNARAIYIASTIFKFLQIQQPCLALVQVLTELDDCPRELAASQIAALSQRLPLEGKIVLIAPNKPIRCMMLSWDLEYFMRTKLLQRSCLHLFTIQANQGYVTMEPRFFISESWAQSSSLGLPPTSNFGLGLLQPPARTTSMRTSKARLRVSF